MRRITLLAATLTVGLTVSNFAAAAEEPASPHSFTGNVGLFSQYVFRGLAQTNEEVALQGGFDYSHSVGIYAGLWGSNISWLRDAGAYKAGGSAEIDLYAGYKGAAGDFSYDLGVLQYWYPGDPADGFVKANTTELYVAGGWKWFTLKYSNAVSKKVFGVRDARGTDYWDLSAAFPIGESGVTLGAHYGIQKYKGTDPALVGIGTNDSIYSYDDWRISVAYDLGKLGPKLAGTEVGLIYTDTNSASKIGYGSVSEGGVYPKNIADDQLTAYVKRTF
ncbi:MAG: TorF family putative porin [Candidatus Methylophosphatis roskildensis]